MAKIKIPASLQKFTDNLPEIEVDATHIAEALRALLEKYPALKEKICSENGSLRKFINLYVNESDIRFLENLDTPLENTDVVAIISAIAGG